jgi:hypothetical protein
VTRSTSPLAAAESSARIEQPWSCSLRGKFIRRIAERALFHREAAAADAAGQLIAQAGELRDPFAYSSFNKTVAGKTD